VHGIGHAGCVWTAGFPSNEHAMDYLAIARSVATFATGGISFMYILAVAFGVGFILSAVVKLIKKGMPRNGEEATNGEIGGQFVIGALLVAMGWTMGLVTGASAGEAAAVQSALSYVREGHQGNEVIDGIWQAIILWCVFLGTIAFFRGFLILNKATQGGREAGDDAWRAFWHILGGALTVQIFAVWM